MTADEEPTAIDLAHEEPFAIGALAVSPATREVSGPGIEEDLEPRVMQVLVALARERGSVVSRDDLVASCWGGRIVGDDAIHRCIAKVRKLGEATGAFELETIPRVGYRLTEARSEPEGALSVQKPAPDATPILAVLPFDNLSGDPDLLFFSDGVSEEILHALSRNNRLKVIGRASSFQFRSPNKLVRTIAGELKTSHLLDGSVRRSGDRVRVSAHLIEATTQTMVWSDRFDRNLSDIFALQDEIADAVASALDVRFSRRAVAPLQVTPEAYDLFLRGSVWSRDVSLDSQRRALALLEQAVAQAPLLARAWGELALTRAQLRYLGEAGITVESVREAAERALALDKRAQGAWGALYLAIPPLEFLEAEALFDRARKLGFGLALARAVHLMDVGRFREAKVELQQALSIDPFQQMLLFFGAVDELSDGDLNGARRTMREAAERWPDVPFLAGYAAVWAAHAGDGPEVDRLLSPDRLGRHPLGPWSAAVSVRIAALRNGPTAGLMKALQKSDAKSAMVEAIAFCAEIAGPDAVFKAGPVINRAAPRRPELGVASLFLPLYGKLRRDKRFPELCAEIGLARYWRDTGVWPDCADEVGYDFRAACLKALADK